MTSQQHDPNDVEAWFEAHATSLEHLAHEAGLAPGLVHLAAALVLAGLDDDEVYEQLGHHVLSLDGQHDPLAGVPTALHEIRRLVAANDHGIA